MKQKVKAHFGFENGEEEYLVFADHVDNHAYNPKKDRINLLFKDGSIQDVADAADQLNINALTTAVTKHFLCFPKEVAR